MSKFQFKKHLSFCAQLKLLRERNLTITNLEKAKTELVHLNYYRLSAYTLTLKKNNKFINETTFDTLIDLYNFDRKLRLLILEVLEPIEISFRTIIAYTHSLKYGPLGYMDAKNFENQTYHSDFMDTYKRNKNQSRELLFVQHHNYKYDGNIPLWAAVELFSFSTLSKFFRNMIEVDRKEVAQHYGHQPSYIATWLKSLSYIRNVCAHYGRIYNKVYVSKPKLSKAELKYTDPASLFAILLIIKKLSPDKAIWIDFLNGLIILIEKNTKINTKHLGFPPNWKDLLL